MRKSIYTEEERRERRNAYNREHYRKNREKRMQQTRGWAKSNKHLVKKILERSRKNNPERKLFNAAKGRAKKSGLEFSITLDDIKIPEYCPLLGIKLDAWGDKEGSPSLDRIDNELGYTPENIWVISFKANRMKNTATLEELDKFCTSYLRIIGAIK